MLAASWATLAASWSTTGEPMGNSCGIMVNFSLTHGQLMGHHGQLLQGSAWAAHSVSWSTTGELKQNKAFASLAAALVVAWF
jgi:hypothetical protein